MTNWKTQMQQALAGGYVRKNQWEDRLRRHLESYLPNLTAELKKSHEFEAYLAVRCDHARRQMALMMSQGMTADDARQQALADLLPTPADEVQRTPAWETLGAVDDSLQGQMNYLLSQWGSKD
jgi:hypothetical protein